MNKSFSIYRWLIEKGIGKNYRQESSLAFGYQQTLGFHLMNIEASGYFNQFARQHNQRSAVSLDCGLDSVGDSNNNNNNKENNNNSSALISMRLDAMLMNKRQLIDSLTCAFLGDLRTELVERVHEFTDCAYTKHEHRETIIQLVQCIKLQLNKLVKLIYRMVSDN